MKIRQCFLELQLKMSGMFFWDTLLYNGRGVHFDSMVSRLNCYVTGERPFTCEVCGHQYTRSHLLKEHMRTHSGERPYICTVCAKTFVYSPALKRHMITHTGEKRYTCPVCSHKFGDCGNLTKHMRTHTGERPFTCEICKKSFSQSDHLKKHLRCHRGDRSWIVARCGTITYAWATDSFLNCPFRAQKSALPSVLAATLPFLVHWIRVRTDPGKVWKVLEFNVEIFEALKMIMGMEKCGKKLWNGNADLENT